MSFVKFKEIKKQVWLLWLTVMLGIMFSMTMITHGADLTVKEITEDSFRGSVDEVKISTMPEDFRGKSTLAAKEWKCTATEGEAYLFFGISGEDVSFVYYKDGVYQYNTRGRFSKSAVKSAIRDKKARYFYTSANTVTYTVTFRVVNGQWNFAKNGGRGDQVMRLNALEGDEVIIYSQPPSAGYKPDPGYQEGSWDTIPTRTTKITKDTVFTYTYAPKKTAYADAPEPIKDLVYDGNIHELVNPGSARGGTMQYALSRDGQKVPILGWSTRIPAATDGGMYYVWYKVIGDPDYRNIDPEYVMVEIGKKDLTVKALDFTIQYGERPRNGGVEYSGFIKDESIKNLSGILGFSYDYTQESDAGEYTITPNGLKSDNYNFIYETGKLTVEKRPFKFDWTDEGFTFDGEEKTVTPEAVTVNGDVLTFSCEGNTGTSAGDYTAEISNIKGEKAGNYTLEGAEGVTYEWKIKKAVNSATVSIENWTYGSPANAPKADADFGSVTFSYSDEMGGEYTDTVPTEAGKYFVKAEVEETNDYEGTSATTEFSINRAQITISADDKTGAFQAEIPELTYKISGAYVEGDDLGISLSTEADSSSPVGEYPIVISWNSNSNYDAELESGKYTITQSDVTVTASGYRGPYDGEAHGITVDLGEKAVADVYYSDSEELTEDNYKTGMNSSPTRTDAGTTTVYFYIVAENHTLPVISGSKDIVIEKAAPSVTAPVANDLIFTGSEQELVSAGSAEGGELQYALGTVTEATGEFSSTVPKAVDIGTYSVWYKVVGDENHNDVSPESVTVTVKPAVEVNETESGETEGGEPGTISGKASSKQTAASKAVPKVVPDAGEAEEPGASFYPLCAKMKKATKNSITLTWKRIDGADSYTVYGSPCGTNTATKLQTVNGTSYTQKNLKKGTYYKYYVVANSGGSAVAISSKVHAATAGKKYGNPASVSVRKKSIKLHAGKTYKLSPTQKNKGTVKRHRGVSYATTNPLVATVTRKGKIRAVTAGKCYIYVYAQNGQFSRIRVTVKSRSAGKSSGGKSSKLSGTSEEGELGDEFSEFVQEHGDVEIVEEEAFDDGAEEVEASEGVSQEEISNDELFEDGDDDTDDGAEFGVEAEEDQEDQKVLLLTASDGSVTEITISQESDGDWYDEDDNVYYDNADGTWKDADGSILQEKGAKTAEEAAAQPAAEETEAAAEPAAEETEAVVEPAAEETEGTAVEPAAEETEGTAVVPAAEETEEAVAEPAAEETEGAVVEPAAEETEGAVVEPAAEETDETAAQSAVEGAEETTEEATEEAAEEAAEEATEEAEEETTEEELADEDEEEDKEIEESEESIADLLDYDEEDLDVEEVADAKSAFDISQGETFEVMKDMVKTLYDSGFEVLSKILPGGEILFKPFQFVLGKLLGSVFDSPGANDMTNNQVVEELGNQIKKVSEQVTALHAKLEENTGWLGKKMRNETNLSSLRDDIKALNYDINEIYKDIEDISDRKADGRLNDQQALVELAGLYKATRMDDMKLRVFNIAKTMTENSLIYADFFKTIYNCYAEDCMFRQEAFQLAKNDADTLTSQFMVACGFLTTVQSAVPMIAQFSAEDKEALGSRYLTEWENILDKSNRLGKDFTDTVAATRAAVNGYLNFYNTMSTGFNYINKGLEDVPMVNRNYVVYLKGAKNYTSGVPKTIGTYTDVEEMENKFTDLLNGMYYTPAKMKELVQYVHNKYPNTSFNEFYQDATGKGLQGDYIITDPKMTWKYVNTSAWDSNHKSTKTYNVYVKGIDVNDKDCKEQDIKFCTAFKQVNTMTYNHYWLMESFFEMCCFQNTQGETGTDKTLNLELSSLASYSYDEREAGVPYVTYRANLTNAGWTNETGNGEMCGTIGRAIHSLKVNLKGMNSSSGIAMRVYQRGSGWTDYVGSGQEVGKKYIEALEMHLTGPMAEAYDIYYRLYVWGSGWMNWAKNGESAGSILKNLQTEGVQIKIVKKGETLSETGSAFVR